MVTLPLGCGCPAALGRSRALSAACCLVPTLLWARWLRPPHTPTGSPLGREWPGLAVSQKRPLSCPSVSLLSPRVRSFPSWENHTDPTGAHIKLGLGLCGHCGGRAGHSPSADQCHPGHSVPLAGPPRAPTRVRCTWLGMALWRGLRASSCRCPPVSASCRGRPPPPCPVRATPAAGRGPSRQPSPRPSRRCPLPPGSSRGSGVLRPPLALPWALAPLSVRSSSRCVHGPQAAPPWSLPARGAWRTRHPVCTLGVLRAVLALPGLAAKRSASSSLELLRFRTRRVGTAAPLLPVTFARGSDLCLRFCRPRPGVHHGAALMCSHIQWRAGPCDSRVDASVSPVGPHVGRLHGVLEVSHPEPCEQVGARWQGAGVGGTSARPLSQRASAD